MLTSINIKGFKSFSENEGITLSSLSQVNYLVGENGSGKSAVLEVLKMISEPPFFMRYNPNSSNCKRYFGDLFYVFKKNFLVEVDYNNLNNNHHDRITLKSDKHNQENISFEFDNETSKMDEHDRIYFCKTHELHYISAFTINSDLRQGNPTDTESLVSPIRFDFNEIRPEHEEIIKDLLNKFHYTKKPIRRIFRSLSSSDTIQFEDTSGVIHNTRSLPSGIKTLLSLIIYMQVVISRETGKNIIICIEEPEVSLNPKLQKDLPSIFNYFLEKFSSEKLQVFITTHSPFLISAASKTISEMPQKVYLFQEGKTCNLARTKSKQDGYPVEKSISVAAELLGAGLADLNTETRSKEKFNIFYCEGAKKDIKDSNLYQIIFPEFDGVKNIFISCGGSGEVENAYLSGKQGCKIVFGENSSVYALFDCSNSSHDTLKLSDGTPLKTNKNKIKFFDSEREKLLSENTNFRMLKRKEIENYLYDISIITSIAPTFDISKVSQVDFVNGEVKNLINDTTGLSRFNKIELAHEILKLKDTKSSIYQELSNCIFPKKENNS